jgi:hypothetical protein
MLKFYSRCLIEHNLQINDMFLELFSKSGAKTRFDQPWKMLSKCLPATCHTDRHQGCLQESSCLTSALVGVDDQHDTPNALAPGKSTITHCAEAGWALGLIRTYVEQRKSLSTIRVLTANRLPEKSVSNQFLMWFLRLHTFPDKKLRLFVFCL